jgi:hypothetical protein
VEVSRVVFADGGADGDAELAFAVETEVTERAGVRTAGDGFEFVDDFHGAEFGRAGNAAAGETGGEGGKMCNAGAQTTFDSGDEVLDLGKTFEPDEFGDLDGAEFADFAEVIAQEVGDHDEFGHFLGAGLEFVGELGVASGIG